MSGKNTVDYGHYAIFKDETDATAAAGILEHDEGFLDDVRFNCVNVDENEDGDYVLSFETSYELTPSEQFSITSHIDGSMAHSFNNDMSLLKCVNGLFGFIPKWFH